MIQQGRTFSDMQWLSFSFRDDYQLLMESYCSSEEMNAAFFTAQNSILKSNIDKLELSGIYDNFDKLEVIKDFNLRVFRNSLFVTCCSIFEKHLRSICVKVDSHLKLNSKELTIEKFGARKGLEFLEKHVNRKSSMQLYIGIETEINKINHLITVRNYIVHRDNHIGHGGWRILNGIPHDDEKELGLMEFVKNYEYIQIENERLHISPRCVQDVISSTEIILYTLCENIRGILNI